MPKKNKKEFFKEGNKSDTDLRTTLNDHAKKVFLYGGFDEENVEAE